MYYSIFQMKLAQHSDSNIVLTLCEILKKQVLLRNTANKLLIHTRVGTVNI